MTIQCRLTGEDGNALSVVGRVKRALRRAGVSKEEIDDYVHAALAGSYDQLLQLSMKVLDEHEIEWE